MQSWITEALDLRAMPPGLAKSAVAERAADTEPNGSFWMVDNREPIEICEFLISIGFTIQTHLFSEDEFLIFAGNTTGDTSRF